VDAHLEPQGHAADPGEDEIRERHQRALDAGLRSHLITDSGRTEFGGMPTITALAIGPDQADAIDLITGDLTIY
jgi:peptidyl-tRNA hydrolase, PTH2 family